MSNDLAKGIERAKAYMGRTREEFKQQLARARDTLNADEPSVMAGPIKTRIRRGKEVVIPPKWVGKIPTKKTKRERPSKMIGKRARELKPGVAYKDAKDIPLE